MVLRTTLKSGCQINVEMRDRYTLIRKEECSDLFQQKVFEQFEKGDTTLANDIAFAFITFNGGRNYYALLRGQDYSILTDNGEVLEILSENAKKKS